MLTKDCSVDAPVAEAIPDETRNATCDATASGTEGAQVKLTLGAAELFFCAHHFAHCELALALAGWRVAEDNRSSLR